jgi:hypothetical protein
MRFSAHYRTPEHNALLREADRVRQRANEIRAWAMCAILVVAFVFVLVHKLAGG